MTKWEYLVTVIDWNEGHWRPTLENGNSLDASPAPPLYDYLNTKGAEGWELVMAPPSNKVGTGLDGQIDPSLHVRLYFKRPAT
ncbi:MAG TPA: hypothetical protein VFN75_10895 [Pseudonocardiaceae bacterium]|nr:hypothetical protein [Pseudonocardiaceae bacterium]